MKCPRCNNDIQPSFRVCPYCGTPLNIQAQNIPPQDPQPVSPTKKKNKTTTIIIIVVCALVVWSIVVSCIIAAVRTSKTEATTANEKSSFTYRSDDDNYFTEDYSTTTTEAEDAPEILYDACYTCAIIDKEYGGGCGAIVFDFSYNNAEACEFEMTFPYGEVKTIKIDPYNYRSAYYCTQDVYPEKVRIRLTNGNTVSEWIELESVSKLMNQGDTAYISPDMEFTFEQWDEYVGHKNLVELKD